MKEDAAIYPPPSGLFFGPARNNIGTLHAEIAVDNYK